MAKQVIEYLSVLPGSGKTHHIIQAILQYLSSSDPEKAHAVIYVAPTIDLIDQVAADLTRSIHKRHHHRIIPIYSQKDSFSPSRTLMVKLGAPPRTKEERILTRGAGEPGCVFLVTHECFACMPLDVPHASEIEVYFDETRSCVLEAPPIIMPAAAVDACFDILEPCNLYNDESPYHRVKGKEDGRSQAKAYLPDRTRADRSNLSRLIELIRKSRLPRYEVYLAVGKDKDLAIEKSNDPDRPSAHRFFNVALPTMMFQGYGRVLIASAWLEPSQMFFLLQNSGRFKMKNVTPEFEKDDRDCPTKTEIGEEYPRQLLLERRLRRLHLIPLTWRDKVLTKSLLRGVLVTPETKYAIQRTGNFSSIPEDDFLRIRDYLVWARHPSRRPDPKAMAPVSNKVLAAIEKAADYSTPGVQPSLYLQPLVWYIQTATQVIKKLKRTGKLGDVDPNHTRPLLCTNRNLADQGLPKGVSSIPISPGSTVMADQVYEQLPPKAHGRNNWQGHNVIVFLCALNPTPDLVRFFRDYCGKSYDYEMDFFITSCAQAIARTSIRDVNSTEDVFAILPDQYTAQRVAAAFKSIPRVLSTFSNADVEPAAKEQLLRKDTPRQEALHETKELTAKERAERQKKITTARNRARLSTDKGKKLNQLIAQRSRRRTALKNGPPPEQAAKLKAQLATLESAIAELRAQP